MRAVPLEVWAGFEGRLDEMRVPTPQRSDYRKWVRFYFDFCYKYGHSVGALASRGPFLAKLTQRSQACAAVGLLFQSAPEAGAKPLSPAATAITSPPAPLNSQPAAPCGHGSTALRPGTRVAPAALPTPRSDLQTIQKLLGHSDIKTTMIYLQTVPSLTLKEAKSPLDLDPSSATHAELQRVSAAASRTVPSE
jgi:hypothetical protein